MHQVTVGPKYQIVIPKEVRKKIRDLRPGAKVMVGKVNGNTISIKTNPKSWVDRTYGMMKDAWKDIDPIAELEKGRDEWEERLQQLEKDFKASK